MNTLTCGCQYTDSLILSFCDLHKYPGPDSHKDGKGIIIRDLEAQVREATLDERERCAELVENLAIEYETKGGFGIVFRAVATKIRERI